LEVLKTSGFDALLVNRRNEVHTALSLLVAAQRGVYNSRQEAPTNQVTIDHKDLLRAILSARKAKEALANMVIQLGFRVHELIYEDRLNEGLSYYQDAFAFLGANTQTQGKKSTLTRMTPAQDYPRIIANYPQILETLRMAKLDHLLAD